MKVPKFPDDPASRRKPSPELRVLLTKILKRDVSEWCNDYASEAELYRLLAHGRDLLHDNSCVGLLDEVVILSWDTHSGPGISYGGLRSDYLKMRRDLKAYWSAINVNAAINVLKKLRPDELEIVLKSISS